MIGSTVETVVRVPLVRADQVADLGLSDAGDAVNGRSDFGETQIELGSLHRGFGRRDRSFGGHDRGLGRLDPGTGGLDLGLSGEIGLDGIIEFLVGDRLLLGQRGVAIHVELGLALIRLGLCELRLGL